MKDIDELITRSLSDDEAMEFKRFEEQGMFEKVAETFRGKSRVLAMLTVFFRILIVGWGIYAVVQFFGTSEVEERILWSSVAIICVIIAGMLKLWFWMELNKNAVMREIKRLELQVVRLSAERSKGKE